MRAPPPPTKYGPATSSVQPKLAVDLEPARHQVPPPSAFAPHAAVAPPKAVLRSITPPRNPATVPPRVIQGRFHGNLRAKGEALALPPSFALPSGQGQPLPDGVRSRMERFFGADFANVRVHIGPQAPAIGALAFTAGDTIVFAPGQYDPASPHGQQILGHELAHVVQQRSGRVRNPFGAGLTVVQDHALEAEADRMGQRASLSLQAMTCPPRHRNEMTVQPYFVLSPDKLHTFAPEKWPWSGYPYAIVPPASLPAQHRKTAGQSESKFLDKNDKTKSHVIWRGGSETALRVSDDYCMAIEDTDLGRRQPKAFFATDAVITASNTALAQAGSPIELVKTGEKVTIVSFWSSWVLYGVIPRFNKGSANKLPQNCNDIASTITTIGNIDATGQNQLDSSFRNLMGLGKKGDITTSAKAYVTRYGDAADRNNRDLSQRHLNQFANPGIGGSYMIHTVAQTEQDQLNDEQDQLAKDLMSGVKSKHEVTPRLSQIEQRMKELSSRATRVFDHQSNTYRNVNWSYHFAAVVARSGGDCVTLENYARGDMKVAGPDPRWYFQMYSQSQSNQTFHEFHKGKGDYANPMTVSLSK